MGILGTGLIGGSIGLRARRNGVRVLGSDTGDAAASTALARGALDERVPREELYERCDYVVIATPLDAACAELRRLHASPPACSLVIDVASVKRPVVAAAAGLEHFVASHPLAGSELSGPGAASADLFEGRSWAYVPSGDAGLDDLARAFILSLGARPIAIDAASHDAAVAVTSHLPQLVAVALAGRIRAAGPTAEALCGPAAAEFLRLGASNFELWREIFAANADEVAEAGRSLAGQLSSLCASIERGDFEPLRTAFRR
ncbi:MAG TPA: prephenate dehydrogenase/arogenate dehydrogenase family protein [Candidatus Tyrphobacter sp.]